jgi:hypothetical protein
VLGLSGEIGALPARGGPKRVVTIARGRFARLRPGEAATLTVAARREARYDVRRRCRTSADGVADNARAGGNVRTVSPVRITRC